MPASPPGNVFPALVVVGHIVTLIAVWQWRARRKQGKRSDGSVLDIKRSSPSSRRLPCSLFSWLFLWSTLSSTRSPPLFSTRLGFLWYGDVAVNPVNAGCAVMTLELEFSALQGSFAPVSFDLSALLLSWGLLG